MLKINNNKTITMKVYNNGLSQAIIDAEKKVFLYDTFRNHTDIIQLMKKYPHNDTHQEVTLSADFVVLTNEEYLKLLNK